MMTVKQVSELTGVSVRTLQYYDRIGLLPPAEYTEAGYRLYDDSALERLQQVLLFRELEFPLKEIKSILESPAFDRSKALEQQIELLELKKEHLENLILYARGVKMIGVKALNLKVFDRSKIDEYARQAKEQWGDTEAYSEFESKDSGRTDDEREQLQEELLKIFAEFGTMRGKEAESPEVQAQVRKLQDFITDNMYTCTDTILRGLGKMYGGGGDFTINIDKVGGNGTAELAAAAIEYYCTNK